MLFKLGKHQQFSRTSRKKNVGSPNVLAANKAYSLLLAVGTVHEIKECGETIVTILDISFKADCYEKVV